MKKGLLIFALIITISPAWVVGQFAPPAGMPGSTAIAADSSIFVAWAKECIIQRGFVNLSDTSFVSGGSNRASYGESSAAIGLSDNSVVSLGDGGSATLTFEIPLVDGDGYDFAVFENSFNDVFLELAFVEISSDGQNFFRFPSFSNSDTSIQTEAYGTTDATKIHNLAGKYRVLFGTPFDISDIEDDPLLNKDNITHVKIVDVVGSINPLFGCRDSQNQLINDPFSTPFASGGFDLDAVGVIHNQLYNNIAEGQSNIKIFPNPCTELIQIIGGFESCKYQLFDLNGILVVEQWVSDSVINISSVKAGCYYLLINTSDNKIFTQKIVKL